jgi:hypothetical protein
MVPTGCATDRRSAATGRCASPPGLCASDTGRCGPPQYGCGCDRGRRRTARLRCATHHMLLSTHRHHHGGPRHQRGTEGGFHTSAHRCGSFDVGACGSASVVNRQVGRRTGAGRGPRLGRRARTLPAGRVNLEAAGDDAPGAHRAPRGARDDAPRAGGDAGEALLRPAAADVTSTGAGGGSRGATGEARGVGGR